MKRRKIWFNILFTYLLLTTGLWMFLNAYTNSYNKLTTEKISPASITLNSDSAEMKILNSSVIFNISKLLPQSRGYYILYLISPDELRFLTSLI